MRFAAMLILMTATWTACGGSQDVCQQEESLLQSEANKTKSCGGDDSTTLQTLATLRQTCETNIKNCTANDISAYESAISCQQSADSTIQCQWFTETDSEAAADQSLQTYDAASNDCNAKTDNVTATCASGFNMNM